MPDLLHSLHNRDLGHLRIVAGLWGVELISAESEAACAELVAALLDPAAVGETLEVLPAEARQALLALIEAGGRMPWPAFTRRFGGLREVGPGRRDREQVYLHPVSATEVLFYRAFIGRGFFDTPGGLQEFAYIPDDLKGIVEYQMSMMKGGTAAASEQLPEKAGAAAIRLSERPEAGEKTTKRENHPLGRPATPKEYARPLPASDRILDDVTTFLAALRSGIPATGLSVPLQVVQELVKTAGLVRGEAIQPEQVRNFLAMSRLQALHWLQSAWQESESFNELRQLPGLRCEGEWTNQPRATRRFLLHSLEALPQDKWWSLPAFVRAVKETYPDFQRPAGDYDSWFIKREADGKYLRGFESWEEVDGALIRYLITGPLFWLGMAELAKPEGEDIITAFRIVRRGEGQRPGSRVATMDETGKVTVLSNGRISVPRRAPRAVRYQIARFCEWEPSPPEEYRYRVSVGSLKRAHEQGLKASQLLRLLAKNAAAEIPPALVKALKRWEANGTEARVERQVILRVSRPEVLDGLRKSRAARFLGEMLSPTVVVVKEGAQSKVLAALAEMGWLVEDVTGKDKQVQEIEIKE